jgi:hypothetical protein
MNCLKLNLLGWCPEGDLNPHVRLSTADFKSIFGPLKQKRLTPIVNDDAGFVCMSVQSGAPIPGTHGDKNGYLIRPAFVANSACHCKLRSHKGPVPNLRWDAQALRCN